MNLPVQISYSHDGSFDGLLCVVFHAFEHKAEPLRIQHTDKTIEDIFATNVVVAAEDQKADRVWQGLIKRTSARNARMVYVAFQSELPEVEMVLWRYLKKVFTAADPQYYQNLLDDDVQNMVHTARKVQREVHRFLGLVRFQKTADGMYFALIEPDHNILWLMAPHFRNRYASQPWIIYDKKRRYGLYYDLKELQEVYIDNPALEMQKGRLQSQVRDIDEDHFRSLWQKYYDSINIEERANPRQMLRLMPRRYWKYLPEKDTDV